MSTAALRRATDPILEGLTFVADFVDDWICRSRDFDEHLRHLGILFSRVLDEGITLNFDKIKFFQVELKFLRHILTIHGLRPDPDKIESIKNFPAPRNVEQIQAFMGLINFCSKFTHKFAPVAEGNFIVFIFY